jgi:hypothetical protein
MSKGKKLLIGFLTFWPFIYVLCLVAGVSIFASFVASSPNLPDQPPAGFFAAMGSVFILHFLTILEAIGVLVFYVIHGIKNPNLPQEQRIWWVLGMFFCGGIVQIVYYFMYIWKMPEA